jgi:hypothetical protein
MKRNQIIIVLFIVVTTAFIGVGSFLIPTTVVNPQVVVFNDSSTQSSVLVEIDGLMIHSPFEYENLQLFPIIGKAGLNERDYITLSEAMKNNMVKLNETGSVNELSIDNMSSAYVFIQAGDIVKGGKQDRTLQTDLILPPKAMGVALNSFCVEQGRWRQREGEEVGYFSVSERNLASRDLKFASKKNGNQSQVWSKVKEQQSKLNENVSEKYDSDINVANEISETSYQLTLENDKLEEYKIEYKTKLIDILKTDGIVGIAYAVNGEVYGLDAFNNDKLFMDLSDKMIDAFIIEAISNKDDTLEFKNVTVEEVTFLLATHKNNKPTNENNQNLNEVTDYAFQEFGPVNRYLTTDTELKGWLHLNYLVASEESSHSLDYTPRR